MIDQSRSKWPRVLLTLVVCVAMSLGGCSRGEPDEVAVILERGVSAEQIEKLHSTLIGINEVVSVAVVTEEQVLDELEGYITPADDRESTPVDSGLASPELRVSVSDLDKGTTRIHNALEGAPGVRGVIPNDESQRPLLETLGWAFVVLVPYVAMFGLALYLVVGVVMLVLVVRARRRSFRDPAGEAD